MGVVAKVAIMFQTKYAIDPFEAKIYTLL